MNDLQTTNSRYLELLKGTLTDTIFAPEPNLGEPGSGAWRGDIVAPLEFVDTHCCSWRKPMDGCA